MSKQQAQEVEETTDQNLDLDDQAAAAVEKLEEESRKLEGRKEAESADEDEQPSSEIIDLDGQDKFIFNGQEYTPEELNKAILRQSDYTRKTQKLAEEQKYIDNLQYDLEAVRSNPKLADQFKKTYPQKYHGYLEFLNTEAKTGSQDDKPESVEIKTLREEINFLKSKLGEFDQKIHEEQVEAENSRLDAVFEQLHGKYDLADEDAVLNRAQKLLDENKDNPSFHLTDKTWERLFRADHEFREKRYSERHKKLLEQQAKQGNRGLDGGAGGVAPGRPRKRISFDEATDQMIQDLS